jgi:hypothetical protein
MKPSTAKRSNSGREQPRHVAIAGLAAVISLMTFFASPAASGQGTSPASSASPADSARPQGSAAAPTQPVSPPPQPAAATSPPTETSPPVYEAEHRSRRPRFGGLGYISIGPFFGDLSGLDDALRAPTALGASYDVGRTALMLGVGGGAVLFSHLWLGVKGFGLATGPFENLRGKAALTGGGGALEFGYVVAPRQRMLIIPFMGLGGFAYNLDVTNRTSGPMPVQQLLVIPPGETRTFKAGIATLDVGIRVERLLFFCSGGFTAGFEVGLLRSLSTRPWQSESVEFTDHPGAGLDGAYLRVNIGGGGFSFR